MKANVETLLGLSNVTLVRGGRTLVSDVSFAVAPGSSGSISVSKAL